MLTRIMKPKDDRDAGFTLIELLVVVAIIGILAAIAIPVFLNQRASARDASVKADINGIAKVMETVYTDTGAYPNGTTDPDFDAAMVANNAVTSPGNYIQVFPQTTGFEVWGCNAESDKGWYYSSSAGGLNPNAGVYTGADCDTDGATIGEPVAPALVAAEPGSFTAP